MTTKFTQSAMIDSITNALDPRVRVRLRVRVRRSLYEYLSCTVNYRAFVTKSYSPSRSVEPVDAQFYTVYVPDSRPDEKQLANFLPCIDSRKKRDSSRCVELRVRGPPMSRPRWSPWCRCTTKVDGLSWLDKFQLSRPFDDVYRRYDFPRIGSKSHRASRTTAVARREEFSLRGRPR